jgi:hypothetical protein
MSVSAAARRAARTAGNLLPNGQWVPDWSMPSGTRTGSGLDSLEINPNRIDPEDIVDDVEVAPGDLVDPYPVVPENWEYVIPPDVTLRRGEDPNLAGAATPLNLDPTLDAPLPPRPAPNDMPGTRPSRPSPDLEDVVPNRNAAPEPANSDARARALALATLGGAGIVSMYDFFPPGSDVPGGSPPMNPPAESPPGGDFRFDPPFPGPGGDTGSQPPGSAGPVTPQMRRARVDEESRIRRLARRAGITPAQARQMVQAGYDEQNIGHVIGKTNTYPDFDQRRQAYMTLREAGSGYQDARLAERQAEVVRRAQERYNPMATLSPEWRDFVMAERLLRDPRMAGASPNDIRARELDTATRLAASAVQQSIRGGIAGQQMQMMADRQAEQRMIDLRTKAAEAAQPGGWRVAPYSIQEQRDLATEALRLQGASAAEIQQIVDEMFPLPRPGGT